MGKVIVKQPDGRFAIWSTVVGDFLCQDKTRQEVYKLLTEEASIEFGKKVDAAIDRAEAGQSQYSYEELVELRRLNHDIHGGHA